MIDTGGGRGFQQKPLHNLCPCITARRAQQNAYVLTNLGRTFSRLELQLLQGMPAGFPCFDMLNDQQVRKLIGNAFSANVVERLLVKALQSVGYPQEIRDRWREDSFEDLLTSLR